jgi:hypothetical protein
VRIRRRGSLERIDRWRLALLISRFAVAKIGHPPLSTQFRLTARTGSAAATCSSKKQKWDFAALYVWMK